MFLLDLCLGCAHGACKRDYAIKDNGSLFMTLKERLVLNLYIPSHSLQKAKSLYPNVKKNIPN